MQSPPGKSAHKLPPLKEAAARLAAKLPRGASTTSSPDIAMLLERLDEPLRDRDTLASTTPKPASADSGERSGPPRGEGNGAPPPPEPKPAVAPVTKKRSGLPRNALVSALVVVALVPLAILFVLLWQDMMRPRGHGVAPPKGVSVASAPAATGSAQPKQNASALEVALSSPDRIEGSAGEVVAFPIAIDATAALPARSIVAITALPEGASFSQGRPYGATGWSLRPDEIGGLQLRLPVQSGASDMRLELVAGDGTVLAQSATQVSFAASPPQVATVDDPMVDDPETASVDAAVAEPVAQAEQTESAPLQQIAQVEPAEVVADAPPLPQRNPSSAGNEPEVKVNTVKVVTIAPPGETRPHDGAYALGSPSEPAQGEWMETKTAVDMHAKAQQSSETVKIVQGGLKVRVTARDKRWIQVTDPATSTTGWIYDRFLTPADPPAQ